MQAHRNRAVLGLDPGSEGAAVLLTADGKTAEYIWAWKERTEKKVTYWNVQWRYNGPHGETDKGYMNRSTVAQVGDDLTKWFRRDINGNLPLVVVEGLFVPRRKDDEDIDKYEGRLRYLITLAETTGMLMGPLLAMSVHAMRPTAAEWRPLVLGLHPHTRTDRAKKAAIDAVTKARPPLVRGLGELGQISHVAEAGCIARFGWLKQREGRRV